MYAAIEGWMTEKFDHDRFSDFKNKLPWDLTRMLDELDTKLWYPAEEVYRAYEYFIEYFKEEMGADELISSIVDFMFRQSITGFMKGMMAFLTPATLIKRATAFWRRVHSTGSISIENVEKKRLRVTLHDWKVHKISCMIFAGWMNELMKLTGSKNIKVEEVHCGLEGEGPCQWVATFQ
jgi:hypothetical protein